MQLRITLARMPCKKMVSLPVDQGDEKEEDCITEKLLPQKFPQGAFPPAILRLVFEGIHLSHKFKFSKTGKYEFC